MGTLCLWTLDWFSLGVCWFGLRYVKLFVLLLTLCFVVVGSVLLDWFNSVVLMLVISVVFGIGCFVFVSVLRWV